MDLHAEQAYLFRHAVLRQAAYQLQPPLQRARVHELALEILENLPGLNLRATALELADHAENAMAGAPDARAAELREKLAAYLATGADHARFNFDYAAAETALRKLMPLIQHDATRHMKAADTMADLCQRMGRHAEARKWFEVVIEHGTSDVYRGRALLHLAWTALESGDFAQAASLAARGEPLNARTPDPRMTVAWVLYHAREHAMREDHDTAMGLQLEALRLAEAGGDWMQAAISHLNVADALIATRKFGQAASHLDAAEALLQNPAATYWRTQVALGRSDMLRVQGRLPQALEALRGVYEFARATGSMGLVTTVRIRRAQLLHEQGQTAAARREAEQARSLAAEIGDERNLREAQRFIG